MKRYNYISLYSIMPRNQIHLCHFRRFAIMHFAAIFFIFGIVQCHAASLQTSTESQQNCSMHAIDLALVLDHSSSIDTAEFDQLREFLNRLISRVDKIGINGTRIAAVRFAEFPQAIFTFSKFQTKKEVEEFFHSFERENVVDGTAIGPAMEFTITNVFSEPSNLPRYMIVVTDGMDSSSLIEDAAQKAKRQNITVIAVGVGNDEMHHATLETIANGDSRHVFTVKTFIELKAIVPEEICTRVEKENPCDRTPCSNGGICAKEGDDGKFSCTCIDNFLGPCCEWENPCANNPCVNGTICVMIGENQTKVGIIETCTNSDKAPTFNCTVAPPFGPSAPLIAAMAGSASAILLCLVAAALCFAMKRRSRYHTLPMVPNNSDSLKIANSGHTKPFKLPRIMFWKRDKEQVETTEPCLSVGPEMHKANAEKHVTFDQNDSESNNEESSRISQQIGMEPDFPTESANEQQLESDPFTTKSTECDEIKSDKQAEQTIFIQADSQPQPEDEEESLKVLNATYDVTKNPAPPLPPKTVKSPREPKRGIGWYDVPKDAEQHTGSIESGNNKKPPKLPNKPLPKDSKALLLENISDGVPHSGYRKIGIPGGASNPPVAALPQHYIPNSAIPIGTGTDAQSNGAIANKKPPMLPNKQPTKDSKALNKESTANASLKGTFKKSEDQCIANGDDTPKTALLKYDMPKTTTSIGDVQPNGAGTNKKPPQLPKKQPVKDSRALSKENVANGVSEASFEKSNKKHPNEGHGDQRDMSISPLPQYDLPKSAVPVGLGSTANNAMAHLKTPMGTYLGHGM